MNDLHVTRTGTWCGCASVTGRAHRLIGRVNQDACVTLQTGGVTVAAVSDGCSSGAHSELGAGVGARIVAAAAARRAAAGAALAALPALVLADWTEELTRLARRCVPHAAPDAALDAAPDGGDEGDAELLGAIVNDAWLATMLVAVARDDRAIVFGVGDGIVSIDGRLVHLEQGEAPDYPAYALFPHMTPPRLTVHHDGAYFEILIATDGARGFEADVLHAAREPRLRDNPSLLQKRLNVVRDGARAPDDDCTVAVIRHEVTPCA